jgi:uncharacterized protein (DUF58 family)
MIRAAAVAICGLGLVLVALTFDASILLVPGVGLVILGVLVPLWIRVAAHGASVTRELHGERVVEEQPLEATLSVRRGWLGLPGCEVIDEFVGGAITLAGRGSPSPGARRSTVRVVARFPRRGRRRFDPPAVVLHDPLGLVRVGREGGEAVGELLVLPRTERVNWREEELGDRLDAATAVASPEPFAATELDGLRPYRPGAPASRIHWAALARGAGLLERRLRSDGDSGPLVVLDGRFSGAPELLDAAVRAAASLALDLARRTGCELLLPGERRPTHLAPDLAAWSGLHARLALVDGGPDTPAPSLGSRPHSGRIYYVAAEGLDRLDRLGLDVRQRAVLVVPIELASGAKYPAVFDVAGCRGFLLGSRRPRLAATRVAAR